LLRGKLAEKTSFVNPGAMANKFCLKVKNSFCQGWNRNNYGFFIFKSSLAFLKESAKTFDSSFPEPSFFLA
jgi:hypothetical protein